MSHGLGRQNGRFGLLAFTVGALTALQSRANGRLAIHLGNGVLAGLVSNLTGWSILFLIVLISPKERGSLKKVLAASRHKKIRLWEMLGGFGGACFLAVQSSSVPIIGIAMFTISLVAGQTASSLLIDKLGIAPSGKKEITKTRLITAVLTLSGVSIAVYPKLTSGKFEFIYVLLAVLIGVLVSFQQAINGRLNVVSGRPFVTAWFNFGAGTLLLCVFLVINLIAGGKFNSLPTNPLLYTGGLIGLIFIAISAYTIKVLGVLNFILFSVAGQVVTALIVDAIAPTAGAKLNAWVIIGTAITFFSIAMPRIFQGKKVYKIAARAPRGGSPHNG